MYFEQENFSFLSVLFLFWYVIIIKHLLQVVNLIMWGATAGILLSVMYAPFDAETGKHLVTLTESDIYNGFQRTAWGIGLSYIIIACALGQGGKEIEHKF